MSNKFKIAVIVALLANATAFAQPKPAFKVIPLGVLGGIDESNLSAYMLAPTGTNDYICLDAGTLHYGIEKAVGNHVFNVDADTVLKKIHQGLFDIAPASGSCCRFNYQLAG